MPDLGSETDVLVDAATVEPDDGDVSVDNIEEALLRGSSSSSNVGDQDQVLIDTTVSGKTFTLSGDPDEPGVIPRVMRDVFAYIRATSDREYTLRVFLVVVESHERGLAGAYEGAASPLPGRPATPEYEWVLDDAELQRPAARQELEVQANPMLILEATPKTRPSTSFSASLSDTEEADAEANDEVKAIAGQARAIQLLDAAPAAPAHAPPELEEEFAALEGWVIELARELEREQEKRRRSWRKNGLGLALSPLSLTRLPVPS
ncbi:hypothetical protein FIBSPDRAFT_940311 [Athelia psychrophila]|uniref:Kinesin motor domain-containing protein n=1 Tax=Athelia psychrophila TaxID=1759441 RepID=A0A167W871_9AGAM|nr:hypothetical protein FIBSPDRAFT_940311 [Fibularhizoctonia sp. CBS 109695]